MRPYQITATERILNRIEIANNYKKYGSVEGGGYIWHTTGSGKTLTSFKTARLASKLPYIDKVLFVVDRKDLDYQTMKEYDRFEKGAANSNTSTTILKRQLEDPDAHIIITTIQKLATFIKKNPGHEVYLKHIVIIFDECHRRLKRQLEDPDAHIIITTIQKLATFIKKNPGHEVYLKHIVIIFDECHRSQFGDMHTAIVKNFKKYHLFGFTGTPIFSVNSGRANGRAKNPEFFTTGQTFGDQLHSYTIVDAINDKNVLPFRVDYIKTMDVEEEITDEMVWDINREKVMMAPERIRIVTQYILEHFDQKTYRGDKTYIYNALTNISEVASAKRDEVEEIKQKQRISGFNSIFAVSSVPMAKLYYQEFKKQMAADPTKKLRVATIFSYGANEEESDGILDEENSEDTSALDQPSREFLEEAIKDYNKMFHTNYDTSSDKFQNYYKDVSLRMKNKELDILIVVNMFLTGFDATTMNTLWVDKNLKMHGLIQAFSRTNRILNSIMDILIVVNMFLTGFDATTMNTLWVDKNLKMHGLIQAFSRTNRILNSIKTFGNIVCFRNLQKRVTTMNTLWVDKNLKMHGLIQAFSRTNRILNSIKTFGNIVCFRNLQKRVDSAISLFGDKNAGGIVLLQSFKDYYYGYESVDGKPMPGYVDMMEDLNHKFPLSEPDKNAGGIVLLQSFKDYYYGYESVDGKPMPGYVDMMEDLNHKFPLSEPQIIGEQNQKDFIALFGAILRMRNLLLSFDEFKGNELISERDLQDYLGRYQDLRDEWKRKRQESTDITDDVVFEIELIRQIEINIDYILMLVKKYHDTHCEDKEVLITINKAIDASPELRSKKQLIETFIAGINDVDDVMKYHDTHCEDKEVLITINKAIDASPELRSKKQLIETFIAGINDVDDVMNEWHEFVVAQRDHDLDVIIKEEKLKPEDTRKFIENAFRDGEIRTVGTDIDKLMPPISRFGGGGRTRKKQGVIEKLKTFFEKYFGIGGSSTFTEPEHKTVVYDLNGQETLSMVAEEKTPYGKQS